MDADTQGVLPDNVISNNKPKKVSIKRNKRVREFLNDCSQNTISNSKVVRDGVDKNDANVNANAKEFRIPLIDEVHLITTGLTLPQLKDICRFYKLRIGGKKDELLQRIKTFFEHKKAMNTLQTAIKRTVTRRWFDLHGPAVFKRDMCVNDMDLMGVDLVDIPLDQFFSFTEQGFTYGFDIASFTSLLMEARNHIHRCNPKNPYTRDEIDIENIKDYRDLLLLSSVYNRDTSIVHKDEQDTTNNGNGNYTQHVNNNIQTVTDNVNVNIDINMATGVTQITGINHNTTTHTHAHAHANTNVELTPIQIEHEIVDMFIEIDTHGHYTNPNWVLDLNSEALKRFIKDMRDVFDYRAGLTDSVKRNIIPPAGHMGESNLRTWLIVTNDINLLRLKALKIMQKLVMSSTETQYRALGTFYVLTALTLSSYEAAQAMPWLYQSAL